MGRLEAENNRTGYLSPVNPNAIYRIIYEVVNELPTENIKTTVIYCVPVEGEQDKYDMYLYIDSAWVQVGSNVDLSDYYTKEETAALLGNYYTETEIDTLLGGKMGYASNKTTAQEINDLPQGQVFYNQNNSTVGVKIAAAGSYGQIDLVGNTFVIQNFSRVLRSSYRPPFIDGGGGTDLKPGDVWLYEGGNNIQLYILETKEQYSQESNVNIYTWKPLSSKQKSGNFINNYYTVYPVDYNMTDIGLITGYPICPFIIGDRIDCIQAGKTTYEYIVDYLQFALIDDYISYQIQWSRLPTTESLPTTISSFINDVGYLTMADLPIYDGAVI